MVCAVRNRLAHLQRLSALARPIPGKEQSHTASSHCCLPTSARAKVSLRPPSSGIRLRLFDSTASCATSPARICTQSQRAVRCLVSHETVGTPSSPKRPGLPWVCLDEPSPAKPCSVLHRLEAKEPLDQLYRQQGKSSFGVLSNRLGPREGFSVQKWWKPLGLWTGAPARFGTVELRNKPAGAPTSLVYVSQQKIPTAKRASSS